MPLVGHKRKQQMMPCNNNTMCNPTLQILLCGVIYTLLLLLHAFISCFASLFSTLHPYILLKSFTFVYINMALVYLISHVPFHIPYLGIIPREVAVFPGGNATFTCVTPCPFQRWNVTPHYNSTKDPVSGHEYTIHINGVENKTTVHCYCLWPRSKLVGESFINVQGIFSIDIYVYILRINFCHRVQGCYTN